MKEQQESTLSVIAGTTHKKKREETIQFKEALCPDDRDKIKPTTPFVLIVEDDISLTKTLIENVRSQGQFAFATQHPQEALKLASDYKPMGIILDLDLSDMAGKSLQIKFTGSKSTKKIPLLTLWNTNDSLSLFGESVVNIIEPSLQKEDLKNTLKNFQRLTHTPFKKANIIGGDKSLTSLFRDEKIEPTYFLTLEKGIRQIKKAKNSFIVLETHPQNLDNLEKLKILEQPILILTNQQLMGEEENFVRHFKHSLLNVLPEGQSLLKEIIHKFMSQLTSKNKQTNIMPQGFHDLTGKTVLIVDDDMRNIFALSAVLEDLGLKIIEATTGSSALDVLGRNAHIDMVLMDIMMPGLDGHAVMQRIRHNKSNIYLPVIAMSAKAMKEDRAKALDAGADEFIPKPIELEQLTSVMELWFKKQQYAS